jgi:putative inorganic carbon (HCO3(-)) transporter
LLDTSMATTPAVADTARRPLALVLAALVVATVATVDPSGLVPSGPLRWTVTLVLMGTAVCALSARPVGVDRATGRLWLALIAWLFVAALAGADGRHAWIGTPDRRLGWFAWCTFPLLFVCGQALVRAVDRQVVLRGAAVAATVLGVWCAFERAGWSLIDESFAGHRVGGPFGQPAYVGAAAVLLLPLSLAIAFDRDGAPGWRVVGAFGGAGALAALLLSQTRGAWIGVLVAVALLGSRHREVVQRRWRDLVLGTFALVVLFAMTPLGGRVADGFDLGRGTTQGRFDDWSTGGRVIEHHPVIGVGPEGYRVVFPQVVSATYVRRHGTAVIPDRAHNGVIDVATEGGIVAGALYAALLALLLVGAWRSLRSRDVFTIALACAVVGYIVEQQFLFPLSELDPLFWLGAGMLLATRVPSASGPRARARRIPLAVPVALAVVVGSGAVMGAREVFADRLLARAADAPGVSDLRDADHATRLRPDSIRVWYAAARIAARGPALIDVDAAIVRVEHGLRDSPRDPALRELDADLVVERAVRSGLDDDRTRARTVVTRYLRDAPNDPDLWLDRGAVAHLDGDSATERDASARAGRLQPEEKS